MDTRELRIGNLVERITHRKEHVCFEIVESIEGKYYGELPSSTCYPISLTEEWLLKFGFKIIHESNKHYAIRHPKGYRDSHLIHFFPTINDQWHLAFSDNLTGKVKDYDPHKIYPSTPKHIFRPN